MSNLPSAPPPTPLEKMRLRRLFRAFPVGFPVTVFVRASKCHITVHYHALDQVELHVSLYAAFGMRLVIERDEAGIYIVARRRRVLGYFSRSEFAVTVPDYCHLAFNLTPGTVRLEHIQGLLQIAPPLKDKKDIPRLITVDGVAVDGVQTLESHPSPSQLKDKNP